MKSKLLGMTICGALCTQACSSSYQPRRTARVVLVIERGAALYVKDGRQVPIGPFGGDLEALVAETPAAAVHAHTARNQLMIGVPGYLVGAAAVIAGVALLSGPIGWVVIGMGAATAGTGLGFMGAGVTHAVDAANIHNDAVSRSADSTDRASPNGRPEGGATGGRASSRPE